MSEPTFRSDILVELDEACGSDRGIARRAWVERPGQCSAGRRDDPGGWRAVIRAMMRHRHGSPFEGGYLSVYVEAPAVVWWEWTRHRFMALDAPDFGFNLESGRYKVLGGQFYVPPPGRPLAEPAGFKPMRPELAEPTPEQRLVSVGGGYDEPGEIRKACARAWAAYERMADAGVAREVARLALPFSVYYAGYVSANPRSWLQFFSLRRRVEGAKYDTFPQSEIEQAARQCEDLFAARWPLTLDAFAEFGRVAP